jgi:hypothetical protein
MPTDLVTRLSDKKQNSYKGYCAAANPVKQIGGPN